MRLFLDTSVLFSGMLSATGGARLILKMGRDEHVELIISAHVLAEVTNVVQRKLSDLSDEIQLLLDTANVQVVPDPPHRTIEIMNRHLGYPADAQVIAAAATHHADYFVTLDKRHFLENRDLHRAVEFPIGTPGDFLAWYRQKQVSND